MDRDVFIKISLSRIRLDGINKSMLLPIGKNIFNSYKTYNLSDLINYRKKQEEISHGSYLSGY